MPSNLPEVGPLGRVEPTGAVTIRRRPTRLPAETRAEFQRALELKEPARVDIALSYAGAGTAPAIRAFHAAGANAIISLGMPPGRCTPTERSALREAVAQGVLVVQSSRASFFCRAVVPQRYNTADGILSGGDLAANKLRILLMVALSAGIARDAIGELLEVA